MVVCTKGCSFLVTWELDFPQYDLIWYPKTLYWKLFLYSKKWKSVARVIWTLLWRYDTFHLIMSSSLRSIIIFLIKLHQKLAQSTFLTWNGRGGRHLNRMLFMEFKGFKKYIFDISLLKLHTIDV